eukprot:2913228-Rhodomonas_salina.1
MGMTSANWDNGSLSATEQDDKWERIDLDAPIIELLRNGTKIDERDLGYPLTEHAEKTIMEEYFYAPSKSKEYQLTKTFRYALGLAFCNLFMLIHDKYEDISCED